MSSRWEGFGLVLAEAMSHRLPIICSDLPFTKEVLDKKNNHLFFQNENIEELAKCMTDIARLTPEQLDQMGKVSLDIAESLKLPTIIKQWENYFEKMK